MNMKESAIYRGILREVNVKAGIKPHGIRPNDMSSVAAKPAVKRKKMAPIQPRPTITGEMAPDHRALTAIGRQQNLRNQRGSAHPNLRLSASIVNRAGLKEALSDLAPAAQRLLRRIGGKSAVKKTAEDLKNKAIAAKDTVHAPLSDMGVAFSQKRASALHPTDVRDMRHTREIAQHLGHTDQSRPFHVVNSKKTRAFAGAGDDAGPHTSVELPNGMDTEKMQASKVVNFPKAYSRQERKIARKVMRGRKLMHFPSGSKPDIGVMAHEMSHHTNNPVLRHGSTVSNLASMAQLDKVPGIGAAVAAITAANEFDTTRRAIKAMRRAGLDRKKSGLMRYGQRTYAANMLAKSVGFKPTESSSIVNRAKLREAGMMAPPPQMPIKKPINKAAAAYHLKHGAHAIVVSDKPVIAARRFLKSPGNHGMPETPALTKALNPEPQPQPQMMQSAAVKRGNLREKEGDEVEMPKKEFKKEHKHLFRVLKKCGKPECRKELKKQKKEYKKEVGGKED